MKKLQNKILQLEDAHERESEIKDNTDDNQWEQLTWILYKPSIVFKPRTDLVLFIQERRRQMKNSTFLPY